MRLSVGSWGTPWATVVAGQLAGATCLWQDLDGLHVDAAPSDVPATSILWGWRPDGSLLRVRLDGDRAFVFELSAAAVEAAGGAVQTVPWDVRPDGRGDARVAGVRGPGPESGGAGAAYEQVIVDGIGDGVRPVTFLRPAARSARG
jgi:hypothetical protein